MVNANYGQQDRRGRQARRHRGWRVLLGAIVMLGLVGGVEGWRWWSDRSYVGSTRQVVFDWGCNNAIFWPTASSGRVWWAGGNPVVRGKLDTTPSTSTADVPHHHAVGRIHFDSYNIATFTSAAGGTMVLHRQHGQRFYATECAFGPL